MSNFYFIILTCKLRKRMYRQNNGPSYQNQVNLKCFRIDCLMQFLTLITNLRSNRPFKHVIQEQNSNHLENIIEKMHFFSFYRFSFQNLTPVKSQLHRKIEQLLLYRMVYATISVNFKIASKILPTFFRVCFVVAFGIHI